MITRFTALPVGQGDSFFYQNENISLLVDGGLSRKRLPDLIRHSLKVDKIDVVICTHNDADHAQGLVGLLESWPVPIHEIWLPGCWSYKLKQLVENEEEFLYELGENIVQLDEEDTYKLENLKFPPEIITNNEDQILESNNDLLEICEESKASVLETIPYIYCRSRFFYFYFELCENPGKQALFMEAIEAASRIREIARLAYNQGVTIKWFDFLEFQKYGQPHGGKRNILEPVNAREVLAKSYNITPLEYLYLSVVNKQSLVFLAFESSDHPSVLFTADSDLDFNIQHSTHGIPMVITAPHHGSEDNKNAYKAIQLWHTNPNQLVWVRSDCKSKKRPGLTFLQTSGNRFCTLCNRGNLSKQTIKLINQNSSWNPSNGVRSCKCQ